MSGQTIAQAAAAVDAWIALQTATTPADWIILNEGTNDLFAMPAQVPQETNYAYVLDALHTRWPTATVVVIKPWTPLQTGTAAILATRIDNVLATRGGWTTVISESTYLPGLFSADDIHPNSDGYAASAAAIKAAMGY